MSEKKKYGPRVTYDEARPTILNLIAAGKARPSAKDLYEALGKRGSVATHQKHIDKYRAEEQPIRSSDLSMPADAQEFYLAVLRRQLGEAKRELEEELTELRSEKATLVDELEKTSDELEEERDRSIDAFAQLQQKLGTIDQLRLELQSAKDVIERTKEEARAAIEEVRLEAAKNIESAQAEMARVRVEAQDLRTQLAKAELRLEALPRIEKEADRLREELKSENYKRHEAEQNAAVHAQKIEGLEARLHDYQTRESETSKRLKELELASMQSRDELKSCELRRLDLERKLDEQKKEAENRLHLAGDEFQRRLISEKSAAFAAEKERSLSEIKERMETEQSLRRELIEAQKAAIKAEAVLKEEIARIKITAKE